MGAVTVVLTLIIAGINIVNYSHVCKMADTRLDYIKDRGGERRSKESSKAGSHADKQKRVAGVSER